MKSGGFLKSWYFWLFLIIGIAIIVRSLPAWMNAAWGGDFGIYYGLTSRFVEIQHIFNEYDGWGGMYNYFPILYIFSALGHWITGVDLLWVMPKIAPIFGGLTIFIFYFIVYHLTKRRDLALLSSLFLAVMFFAAAICVLALSGTFKPLAVVASGSILVIYAGVSLAALRIRHRDGRPAPGTFTLPGGPLISVLSCVVVAWQLWQLTRAEALGLAALMGGSVTLYATRRLTRS